MTATSNTNQFILKVRSHIEAVTHGSSSACDTILISIIYARKEHSLVQRLLQGKIACVRPSFKYELNVCKKTWERMQLAWFDCSFAWPCVRLRLGGAFTRTGAGGLRSILKVVNSGRRATWPTSPASTATRQFQFFILPSQYFVPCRPFAKGKTSSSSLLDPIPTPCD